MEVSSHLSDQPDFQKHWAADSQHQQPNRLIAIAIIQLSGLECFAACVTQRLLPPVAAPGVLLEDCLQAPQSSSVQLGVGLVGRRNLQG